MTDHSQASLCETFTTARSFNDLSPLPWLKQEQPYDRETPNADVFCDAKYLANDAKSQFNDNIHYHLDSRQDLRRCAAYNGQDDCFTGNGRASVKRLRLNEYVTLVKDCEHHRSSSRSLYDASLISSLGRPTSHPVSRRKISVDSPGTQIPNLQENIRQYGQQERQTSAVMQDTHPRQQLCQNLFADSDDRFYVNHSSLSTYISCYKRPRYSEEQTNLFSGRQGPRGTSIGDKVSRLMKEFPWARPSRDLQEIQRPGEQFNYGGLYQPKHLLLPLKQHEQGYHSIEQQMKKRARQEIQRCAERQVLQGIQNKLKRDIDRYIQRIVKRKAEQDIIISTKRPRTSHAFTDSNHHLQPNTHVSKIRHTGARDSHYGKGNLDYNARLLEKTRST